MLSRFAYRTRQFWNALPGSRRWVETEVLLPYLSSSQVVLFRRMQPSEQTHAYQMFKRLNASGRTDPDLLSAALLHDVGKTLYPLSLIDRVVIVLGKRFFGRRAGRWSEGTPINSAAHSLWPRITPDGGQTWLSKRALLPGPLT